MLLVHHHHGGGRYRWVEVGHHNAFHKLAGGVCNNGGGFGIVTEMMLETIPFGDGEAAGGAQVTYIWCNEAWVYIASYIAPSRMQ